MKHHFYGYLEKVKSVGENLTEVIERFGADNKHLAKKTAKFGWAKVAQLVSNCDSKSDR